MSYGDLACRSCDGIGFTILHAVCPECGGTGRIDPDAFESEPYWEPRC